MKPLRFLFMAVLFLFAVTWLQATIPDTKENLKTEKLKNETSAKMVKQCLEFQDSKTELNFVITPNFETDLVTLENNDSKVLTNSIQKLSKSVVAKNIKASYRNPRDGLRC